MHTYERLSELRSDSIPELLVIDRFVNTLPQRCKEIYSKFENLTCLDDSEESKAQYHQQKICNYI